MRPSKKQKNHERKKHHDYGSQQWNWLGSSRSIGPEGARLILCGRRENRLKKLQAQLDTPSHLLVFDVGDRKKVFEKINSLPEAFSSIDILINNAGNAHGLNPVHKADLNDWDAMIDSNVKGLMYVTKAVLPSMISRKTGHIINLGSIAGKEVYPNGSVYCSSKFAVDAFTQGLRLDLNSLGIKVSAIHPGMVDTEFSEVRFKGDKDKASQVYEGLRPLHAKDVADVILYMVQAPEHVNVADVLLLPKAQANTYMSHRKS
ncbi:MAG: SDR family NAD(P)-dependent oxidoreductase [Flavobacteriaceae bacterium]